MGIKLAGHTQVRTPVRHDKNDQYWKTPVTYRKDGTPVYPIGGASPDDDGDGDDDDAADDSTDDDDLDDDAGDDGDGDDDDLTDAEKKLADKLEKSLDEKLKGMGQQIADRLVNAQQTAARKAARQKAREGGGTGSGAGGKGGKQEEAATAVDHTADIREGRVAYREYVSDQISFTSTEERNAATTLATALIEKAVRDGDDPDDAGRDAAESVAKTLKGLRLTIRKQTIAQLRKDGRLVEKEGDGAGSQQNRTRNSGSGRGDMQKGAAAAARLLPGRVKTSTK